MPKLCPLLKEPCVEHQCEWYIQLLGTDPQTGHDVNKWGCSVSFMPMLTIENSQQQRQTGAAVESFRNEVVAAKGRDQMIEMAKALPAIEGGR